MVKYIQVNLPNIEDLTVDHLHKDFDSSFGYSTKTIYLEVMLFKKSAIKKYKNQNDVDYVHDQLRGVYKDTIDEIKNVLYKVLRYNDVLIHNNKKIVYKNRVTEEIVDLIVLEAIYSNNKLTINRPIKL